MHHRYLNLFCFLKRRVFECDFDFLNFKLEFQKRVDLLLKPNCGE